MAYACCGVYLCVCVAVKTAIQSKTKAFEKLRKELQTEISTLAKNGDYASSADKTKILKQIVRVASRHVSLDLPTHVHVS